MGIETLEHLDEINGFQIVHMDKLREKYPEKFNESGQIDYKWFEKDIRPNHFIYERSDVNSLTFTMQTGPIKEVGINGCQVDTLIHAAKAIIEKLNDKLPCRENALVITKLDEAIQWLDHRTRDREKRDVEGTSRN